MEKKDVSRSYSWVEVAALAEVVGPEEKKKEPILKRELPDDFFDQPDNMQDKYRLLKFFQALANPLRLDIIELLMAGPAHAKDIAYEFGEAPNTLTRHLRILEEAGIVVIERKGKAKLYRIKEGIEHYLK